MSARQPGRDFPGEGRCLWMHNDPTEPVWDWCARPVVRGKSYCATHAELCVERHPRGLDREAAKAWSDAMRQLWPRRPIVAPPDAAE